MANLLIDNPNKYIIKNLGYKYMSELEKATEIYLAEQSLYPRFDILYNDKVEWKAFYNQAMSNYRENNPNKFNKGVLNPIYFFHFLNYCNSNGFVNGLLREWQEYVAFQMLKSLQINNKLKNNVTKLLFRLNDYYERTVIHNQSVLESLLNDNSNQTKEKILKVMIIQNNEIYSLELERMEQTKEYEVYEKYKDDLIEADIMLEERHGILYEVK